MKLAPGVMVMVVRPGSLNAGRTGVIKRWADGREKFPSEGSPPVFAWSREPGWVVEASGLFDAKCERPFGHMIFRRFRELPWRPADLVAIAGPSVDTESTETRELEHA